MASAVGDVVDRALIEELPHRREASCPRTEPPQCGAAAHVASTEETDLRIEIVADRDVFELRAVTVAVVIELTAVAEIVGPAAVGLRTSPVRVDVQIVVKAERAIETVDAVGAAAALPDRPAGQQQADTAAPKQIAFETHDREIRGPDSAVVLRLHVDQAQAVPTDSARRPATGDDRYGLSIVQTDSAAVEQNRHVAVLGRKPTRRSTAEREESLILEEEIALLGEEHAEARQVHLLLIGFDLREVGVV